ncbi:MAG: hypothetical protein R3E76_05010 [Planctomycetota bacterium]
MHGVLTHATLARIPASALALLGRLRAYASVEVRFEGEQAWVRWDEAGFEILRALLPVAGAEFYERLDSKWHLCGHSLPAFEIPEDGFQPLATMLAPARVHVVTDAATDHSTLPRVLLGLKRTPVFRSACAMLCKPQALSVWAGMATQSELRGLEAAQSGDLVLVRAIGDAPLPVLPNSERYWGERLLCLIGHAPDPDLPESALLPALGVNDDELALVRPTAVEVIPRAALRSLTRASARLGAGA